MGQIPHEETWTFDSCEAGRVQCPSFQVSPLSSQGGHVAQNLSKYFPATAPMVPSSDGATTCNGDTRRKEVYGME